jgi:hypothetical protein
MDKSTQPSLNINSEAFKPIKKQEEEEKIIKA